MKVNNTEVNTKFSKSFQTNIKDVGGKFNNKTIC